MLSTPHPLSAGQGPGLSLQPHSCLRSNSDKMVLVLAEHSNKALFPIGLAGPQALEGETESDSRSCFHWESDRLPCRGRGYVPPPQLRDKPPSSVHRAAVHLLCAGHRSRPWRCGRKQVSSEVSLLLSPPPLSSSSSTSCSSPWQQTGTPEIS